MPSKYSYICVSCNEVKFTSSKRSYICRPCLARRNLKRASEAAAKARTLKPYEALYRVLLRNAKIAKHKVDLTYQDFVQFTKVKNCYYCDSELIWNKKSSKNSKGMVTNLDRKDATLGYSLQNCVPCCGKCNRVKTNFFSHSEFLKVVKLIKNLRGFW